VFCWLNPSIVAPLTRLKSGAVKQNIILKWNGSSALLLDINRSNSKQCQGSTWCRKKQPVEVEHRWHEGIKIGAHKWRVGVGYLREDFNVIRVVFGHYYDGRLLQLRQSLKINDLLLYAIRVDYKIFLALQLRVYLSRVLGEVLHSEDWVCNLKIRRTYFGFLNSILSNLHRSAPYEIFVPTSAVHNPSLIVGPRIIGHWTDRRGVNEIGKTALLNFFG
jgi:hypothetical protein